MNADLPLLITLWHCGQGCKFLRLNDTTQSPCFNNYVISDFYFIQHSDRFS